MNAGKVSLKQLLSAKLQNKKALREGHGAL